MNRHPIHRRGPNQIIQLNIQRYQPPRVAVFAPFIFSWTINRTRAERQPTHHWYVKRLVDQMVHDVRHHFANYMNLQNTSITHLNRRISGMLIIQQRQNTNSSLLHFLNLNEVSVEKIEQTMQRISQSQRRIVNVFEMVFKIIIPQEAYQQGAGIKKMDPNLIKKAPLMSKSTYENQVYYERQVNCAAYALELGLNYHKKQYIFIQLGIKDNKINQKQLKML
jgi:hypothetical protein